VEASTVFALSASQWSDADLPLSFIFGYVTTSSSLVTLQSRSAAAFALSQLPAGDGSGSQGSVVVVFAQVLDNLDCNATATASATVTSNPALSSFENILSWMQSQANSSSSVDDTKRRVALTAHLANRVDCSAAPNCSALHRLPCTSGYHLKMHESFR
jgi:hypothetical protein